MSLRALQVALRERDEKTVALASERAARADAVRITQFIVDMLALVDPSREGRNARVMDILDAAAASSEADQ